MKALATAALMTCFASSAFGDPTATPDFFFDFAWCQIYSASLGTPPAKNDGFVQFKTKGHSTACVRSGRKELDCVTAFEEPQTKPIRYPMKVRAELTQMLVLETENGGDYLMARPDTGRVNMTIRMAHENGLGVKVCHGTWVTGDELKALKAKKARP